MRAKNRWVRIVPFLVVAVVGVLLLPAAFAAGEPPAWVGSYWGSIESGGDTVPATIWIESVDADTARVSVQVPGLPVLSSLGKVAVGGGGEFTIPLDFGGAGVSVGSRIQLVPSVSGYDITGEGSGSAFGASGQGSVAARQYYKYIAMPSLADQMTGTLNALLGKPTPPAGFPETGASAPPVNSPVQPYEYRPPLGLADLLAAEWILTLLSFLLFAI
jgi:hypothetical protein